MLESRDKKRVTVNMAREQRPGKVFVDWSQNDRHKTTVCAYSLRDTARRACPRRSRGTRSRTSPTPTTATRSTFEPADVIARVAELGDLYAGSLAQDQDLPELG